MTTVGSIKKVKLKSLFKFFGPDSTVSEIADLMDLEDIGAVPILDESYLLLGIVSERDIVRKLVKNGRDSDLVTAKDIMTKKIITVKKTTTLVEAVRLMKDNNIRHLPIIDENKKLVNFKLRSPNSEFICRNIFVYYTSSTNFNIISYLHWCYKRGIRSNK